MLRLAPAERVCAIVEMNAPGVWVLGEVRKHVQAAGMGIVIEYAAATGKPVWTQPEDLIWDYRQFASSDKTIQSGEEVTRIVLAFDSKFQGHGNEELWRINGGSNPQTDEPILKMGQRYRLVLKNLSADDHPMHLHRHTFEVRQVERQSRVAWFEKGRRTRPRQKHGRGRVSSRKPGTNTLSLPSAGSHGPRFHDSIRYA